MTSKTLKTKKNISLTLDDEFIQFCRLNKIDDIEKLAKETFKRGFDLLKYGNIPMGELTSQDKEKVVKTEVPPPPPFPSPRIIKEGGKVEPPPEPKTEEIVEDPIIVEAKPLKSSDGKDAFTKMGVVTKTEKKKKNLYDE